MYKSSYADGQKWFEWLKMEPSAYNTLRINGDGSHDVMDQYKTKAMAKKWVQFMNDNYATPLGREKVFKSSDAHEFLSKATYQKMNQDESGYPLCPVYKEKVLPDEKDLCSLCGQHSASTTVNSEWATLKQLDLVSTIPF